MYKYPLALTQQFRFCGNPFRLDFYKGCDFGCKYCFANARGGGICHELDYADFSIVEDYFKKAFDNDKPTKNINVELLRNKTPIHIGGMSDPFQTREWTMKLNYKMIELSNKYNYPLIFSTKTASLPDEYYKILNPKLHAFQVSIMGYDDEFIRKYETHTPTAIERINFVKTLHEKGFWVSVRLQPLVDLDQAIKVCKAVDGIANYITVEHLKIPTDNKAVRSLFEPIDKTKYYRPSSLRNYELAKEYKIENINLIKSVVSKSIIGVGDNDLHYLSQSRCCCGVDTIGGEFDNYIKYNLTYFATSKSDNPIEEFNSVYIPQNNVSSCLNPDTRLVGVKDYKTYTDYYCHTKYDFLKEGSVQDYFKSMNFTQYNKNKRAVEVELPFLKNIHTNDKIWDCCADNSDIFRLLIKNGYKVTISDKTKKKSEFIHIKDFLTISNINKMNCHFIFKPYDIQYIDKCLKMINDGYYVTALVDSDFIKNNLNYLKSNLPKEIYKYDSYAWIVWQKGVTTQPKIYKQTK